MALLGLPVPPDLQFLQRFVGILGYGMKLPDDLKPAVEQAMHELEEV